MNDFYYRKLDAYKLAKELTIATYQHLQHYPGYEQHALCHQMRRAAISIPSNIAEGMGRMAVKERIHFVEIAYGSLTELMCQFDISQSLQYISQEEYNRIENLATRTAMVLSGLKKSLESRIT